MRRIFLLLAAVLPLLLAIELISGPAAIDLGSAFADWFAGATPGEMMNNPTGTTPTGK